MTTPAVALTEITLMFTGYWGGRVLQLPNTNPPERIDGEVFAELSFEHTDGGQSSLVNANNKRKYTDDGVCLIELFFPVGIGAAEPYQEAEAVRSLFRGKRTASDTWFRNVRIIEHNDRTGNPSRHKDRYQIDVVFDFTYDGIS